MELTEQEKEQIKYLVRDPKFRSVERFVEVLIGRIRGGSVIRDDDFSTLKEALKQEYKVDGITQLIQELNKIANE
jgi:hypothetical protein